MWRHASAAASCRRSTAWRAGRRRPQDWFYFVNGVEADKGAAEYELSPGDRVQWDYRDWGATMRVPRSSAPTRSPSCTARGQAPAGAGGVRGRRVGGLRDVKEALERAGVPLRRLARRARGEKVTALVVGTRPRRADRARRATLEQGPEESGVFARFADDGRSIELLDERGRRRRRCARRRRRGSWRPAARGEELVWLVTGLDEQGVKRPPTSSTSAKLRDASRSPPPAARRELPVAERMSLIPVFRPARERPPRRAGRRRRRFCAAFALAGALYETRSSWAPLCGDPAGAGCGRGGQRDGRRGALALPLAMLVTLVNPLVYHGGDTLLVSGGVVLGRRFDSPSRPWPRGAGRLRVIV